MSSWKEHLLEDELPLVGRDAATDILLLRLAHEREMYEHTRPLLGRQEDLALADALEGLDIDVLLNCYSIDVNKEVREDTPAFDAAVIEWWQRRHPEAPSVEEIEFLQSRLLEVEGDLKRSDECRARGGCTYVPAEDREDLFGEPWVQCTHCRFLTAARNQKITTPR